MKFAVRLIAIGVLFLVCFAGPASAQYMRITTDNPTDNTRLRATGTTILTITLDTNHDKDTSLQTCNSHTAANCAALVPDPAPSLEMFAYTLALKAVGGTVTWGAFTAADANYTPVGTDISSSTEIEINRSRPAGTFTPPGLSTLGTLPVTIATGAPRVDVQIGASVINPFGFGTGFGTSCDGFFFPNTYVVGDPTDPCGEVTGIAGDWFDWDGAGAPLLDNTPPQISAPPTATGAEGTPIATITATATDPDAADVLTITQTGMPASLTFTHTPGPSPETATITGTPGFTDAGPYNIVWSVSDGTNTPITTTTVLTISDTNQAPILNAIANMTVDEGATADQVITGSDPDGTALVFNKLAGPAFMTVSTTTATTGSIHLAPDFNASTGSPYTGTVRATDGTLFADQSFSITVNNVNRAPSLNAVADMTVAEGATADQGLTATDPDGDALTYTQVTGFSFVTVSNTSPTTGNVHVAPLIGDAGAYTVTVRASDGSLSSDQSFDLTVTPTAVDNPPVLNAIADVTVQEGTTADVPVSATDADGDAISFATSLPSFATFTPDAQIGNTRTGTIHIAPLAGDAGTYDGSVTATANAASDTELFTITVTAATANENPIVTAPPTQSVNEGVLLTFQVSATDADGDPVSLSAGPVPSGASFADNGNNTGTFTWTPSFSQSGIYNVTFTGSDGKGGTGQATTEITVIDVNREPTADPNGPYSGVVGLPITFDGTASSDPDGDVLTFAWDFNASDGITVDATGAMPVHTYLAADVYTVTLTVTDDGVPPMSNTATTTATISTSFPASAFLAGGHRTIRLGSGKPLWCVQLQPVSGSFVLTDVVLGSIKAQYGTAEINAIGDKTIVDGDRNGDGITEIKACFSKEDLRTLFAALPVGREIVEVTIVGTLTGGATFEATVEVDVVKASSGALARVNANAHPNPLNPATTISFQLGQAGSVRLQIFDVSGRLVRTLRDETMPGGYHEVRWDGTSVGGGRVSSGVYFYVLKTDEGTVRNQLVVMK